MAAHAWVGAYPGGSYGFSFPTSMAFGGAHLWVANLSGSSVTELGHGGRGAGPTTDGPRRFARPPDRQAASVTMERLAPFSKG